MSITLDRIGAMDNVEHRLDRVIQRIAEVCRNCFIVAFLGVFVCGIVINPFNERLAALIGLICLLITVTAGMLFIVSLVIRDIATLSGAQVRFGVRSLFVITTALALALGLVAYLLRH